MMFFQMLCYNDSEPYFMMEVLVMSQFQSIAPESLQDNFFSRIGKEWSLVTAGTADRFNTMTASWGGVGVLWNKNVAFTFIRQSRYTLSFVNDHDYYTLTFFGDEQKKALAYCGSHSGRDVDKIKETGLTPVFDKQAPYFAEADMVLVCRKLYRQTMTADSFLDPAAVDRWYGDNDWHEVFVGEIVEVLKKA